MTVHFRALLRIISKILSFFSPVVVPAFDVVLEVCVVDVSEVLGANVEVEVEPIVPIFSLHKGVWQRHSSTLNKPWKASCSLQPIADSPSGLQVLRHCNVPFNALTTNNKFKKIFNFERHVRNTILYVEDD